MTKSTTSLRTGYDVQGALDRAMTLEVRIHDCEQLLTQASAFANRRWDPDTKTFQDGMEKATGLHLVNTSTALTTIADHPRNFDRQMLSAFEGLKPDRVADFFVAAYKAGLEGKDGEGFWESKATGKWTPYITSLALRAVAAYESSRSGSALPSLEGALPGDARLRAILKVQTARLLRFTQDWATRTVPLDLRDYDHTYFTYTALDALSEVKEANSPKLFALDSAAFEQCRKAVVERWRLEFYSQMTFTLAGLPQHLDVVSLALSLVGLVRFGSEVDSLPDEVVSSALETIFSLQEETGFWQTGTLLGTATGRVGCSSVELANCLLKLRQVTERFDAFADHFDRLLQHHARSYSHLAPERGWSVELRRDGNARQTWYGFLVYEFFIRLKSALRKSAGALIHRGFKYTPPSASPIGWDALVDFCGSRESVRTQIIEPWKPNGRAELRRCSLILFGPPGTGKTTFARALAGELGWGLVEVGPGDFLAQGVDRVFTMGESIFQRLLLLKDVVVLFDEIDEWVQERNPESDKMSRFLTTYMLPWIQRLRDRASLVFIFATNHIEHFDPAIKRVGRFDLIVPYGPPQGAERLRVLNLVCKHVSGTELQRISELAPPWATIGDITSAIDRVQRKGDLTAQAVAGIIEADRKSKIKDWAEFVDFATRYVDTTELQVPTNA